jgi:hypothetical protein
MTASWCRRFGMGEKLVNGGDLKAVLQEYTFPIYLLKFAPTGKFT